MIAPPRSPPVSALATPNVVARHLTGRDYLSYSAIHTYQQCPLRYYFHYVAALAPEFVSSSLVFGGAIHAAIEHHWRRLFEGAAAPGVDDLVSAYDRAWTSALTGPVRFGKGESVSSLHGLAECMLAAFVASSHARLVGTLLGVEEEFRAPLIPGCPDLLSRMDLLMLTPDTLRLVDFKTARSRWGDAQLQEAAPQMLLYSELVRPIAAEYAWRELVLDWVVLTKTKQVSIERHTLRPDPRQVARAKAVVRQVWAAIRAGSFYPAPSALNCASCPYWTACQRWEGPP